MVITRVERVMEPRGDEVEITLVNAGLPAPCVISSRVPREVREALIAYFEPTTDPRYWRIVEVDLDIDRDGTQIQFRLWPMAPSVIQRSQALPHVQRVLDRLDTPLTKDIVRALR